MLKMASNIYMLPRYTNIASLIGLVMILYQLLLEINSYNFESRLRDK